MTDATTLTSTADERAQVDWRADLPAALRQVVEANDFKTPADLAAAFAGLQRTIGSDKITLPKNGAWDEAAREKLGIPKDAAGYKLKRPEALPSGMTYDEAFEHAALPVAHRLGLTPSQLQGLFDFYAAHAGDAHEAAARAREKDESDSTAMLQKEWGKAYEAKSAQAMNAARRFGGDVLVNLLTSAGLRHRPEIMRAFASIADTTGDWIEGERALTPDEARREARKLMDSEAYQKHDHDEHAASVKKVASYFQIAYPNS